MKLEGYRVVDLSQFLPGPHLTMLMADHGADVIKIEAPGGGDPGREIGLRQGGESVFFRNANRGKRSVRLDLKDPADRETLLALIDSADVVVESFRPGVAARLGFGADAVLARKPSIVYCSIAAFGQTGPYRDVPAHNLAIEALAGTVSVNLGNDGEPAMPGIPAADMASSLMALSAILMALLRREKTGRGDRIDISMHDCLVAWLPNVLGPVFAEDRAPVPKHERTWGGSAFYHIYRTRDGRHVVLGAQEIKFVRALLQELGHLELVELCERGPGPHQQPLVDLLQRTFATRTRAEWIEWFRGRDVSFAPVNDLKEALEDPQLAARGMVLRDAAGHRHLGIPMKFEHEPGQARLAVPAYGEHTGGVLATLGRRSAARGTDETSS
ncbi:MAG: CoA transferase [Proteobacteria bacterium]|nr:CoA transferase [Pseudomonadota bacterium]